MTRMQIVGDNIRRFRIARDLSQGELAERISRKQSMVSMYENGQRLPSTPILTKIANVLNVSFDAIYYSEEERNHEVLDWYQDSFDPNDKYSEEPVKAEYPDIDTAAQKAAEILVEYRITSAPILPLSILNSMPDVFVVTFTEMADSTGLDNDSLVTRFGADSQDAVTYVVKLNGKRNYIVAYNQRLPFYMIHMALARELGHIVLGHDNSQKEEPQIVEALFFARHLLCPRPLIHALTKDGITPSIEMIGNITGCYGRSIAGMRETPGAKVPPELNRIVKEQFSGYMEKFTNFRTLMQKQYSADLADFGTYMDNYEE